MEGSKAEEREVFERALLAKLGELVDVLGRCVIVSTQVLESNKVLIDLLLQGEEETKPAEPAAPEERRTMDGFVY